MASPNGPPTDGRPLVMSGTRFDLAAWKYRKRAEQRFRTPPPSYPLLDLPFSAALDCLALGFTLPAAAVIGSSIGRSDAGCSVGLVRRRRHGEWRRIRAPAAALNGQASGYPATFRQHGATQRSALRCYSVTNGMPGGSVREVGITRHCPERAILSHMTVQADSFVTALQIARPPPEWDVDAARAALARARATRDAQALGSLSTATLAAYACDWRRFVRWCADHAVADAALVPLPTSDATLSTWIGAHDALRPSTLRRTLAAVRLVHRWVGEPLTDAALPLTLAAVRGHTRRHAKTPPKQVRAATGDLVWRMADACDPDTSIGIRNRALILVGFDAALRSDELVGIDHAHLAPIGGGVALTLPRSKTDQAGRGACVVIAARPESPWCPTAALARWIEASGRTRGAVFVALRRGRGHAGGPVERLSTRAVARAVRASADAAGLVLPTESNPFSSHSLRRGLITSALNEGTSLDDVRRHARHRSIQSTLGYREVAEAARHQPRARIGPVADDSPVVRVPAVRTDIDTGCGTEHVSPNREGSAPTDPAPAHE